MDSHVRHTGLCTGTVVMHSSYFSGNDISKRCVARYFRTTHTYVAVRAIRGLLVFLLDVGSSAIFLNRVL